MIQPISSSQAGFARLVKGVTEESDGWEVVDEVKGLGERPPRAQKSSREQYREPPQQIMLPEMGLYGRDENREFGMIKERQVGQNVNEYA